VIAGSRRRAPVTGVALDPRLQYVVLANPVTGHGPILYPSIATEIGRPEGRWKSCRAATKCDHRHHPRQVAVALDHRDVHKNSEPACSTNRKPACSTTSRTRRFTRAVERRAAPFPDVACARRWIVSATVQAPVLDDNVSPDLLSLALVVTSLDAARCTAGGRIPSQRGHHAELDTGETRSRLSELRSKQEQRSARRALHAWWCSSPRRTPAHRSAQRSSLWSSPPQLATSYTAFNTDAEPSLVTLQMKKPIRAQERTDHNRPVDDSSQMADLRPRAATSTQLTPARQDARMACSGHRRSLCMEQPCWLWLVAIANAFTTGCGSRATCVEGASVACACPTGGSGAQVCNARGAFEPCSCAAPATKAATGATCLLDSMKCDKFSTQGLAGWKLHKLVFEARNAKRDDEALCLARINFSSADAVLAGASYYEASYAWEGRGCRAAAVEAIEQSLHVRPSDKNGWKETCARCAELRGRCDRCTAAPPEASRPACPSVEVLTQKLGHSMLRYAPEVGKWAEPSVSQCTPIALPDPGWYVIGSLHRDSPDRYFTFHMAVNAASGTIVAASPGEERKYNYVCSITFGRTIDRPGVASSLQMQESCLDKMGVEDRSSFTATIKPPQIEFQSK
jgi:hypothetical protein